MNKCSACGKFMGTKGGVTCPKCGSKSHNECVRVPAEEIVSDSWRCGDCQAKKSKGRDPSTPIRGMQDHYLSQSSSSLCESTAVASGTAKIPKEVDDEVIRAMRDEMLTEFGKMNDLMKSEFKSSKAEMGTISEAVRELRRELSATRSALNERMDKLDARIVALELARDTAPKSPDVSSLEQALAEVKVQLNDREQGYLLNDVLITGFPESKGENPMHIALLLASKMGVDVEERDVVVAEREGAPRRTQDESSVSVRSRRIAVRFSRRSTRDAYLRAARVRRGLNSSELGVEGAAVRIYINERLTKTNSQLFAKAREASRERMWKYCWTREGRVYVRKEHGSLYYRVRDEKDIERIFVLGTV